MSWHSFSAATFPLAALMALVGIVASDVKAPDREAAKQLVAEALHREIYGLPADRDRLLAAAAIADPNYAPAKWHQGFVRVGSTWSHVYDAPRIIGTSSTLTTYRKLREECRDTLAQTYNLVVAEFNTYVVGTGKILSHDVTNRRPTRTVVPGFLAD